jgi:uncharacterized protein (DUF302 family)
MAKSAAEYAFSVRLDAPYAEAVSQTVAALKDEGFGVLTKIDVKATLQQKLGAEFRKYVILGACNPPLAYRALQADLDVGLLLPCNVVVYEQDVGSVVAIIDPISMLGVLDQPALEPIASEARAKLASVIQRLGGAP